MQYPTIATFNDPSTRNRSPFKGIYPNDYHFSLRFHFSCSGKVSHATTTRPSRDSWNIGRRLVDRAATEAHKSSRPRRNAFTQQKCNGQQRTRASAEVRREHWNAPLDKSADNTIRVIINLIANPIGIGRTVYDRGPRGGIESP